MHSTYKYLLPLFFALLTSCLSAQDYIVNVQQFGMEEGLSSRIVNAVFQDKDGFLWLATPAGLQRHDGYEFKSFPALKNTDFTCNYAGQLEDGSLYLVNTINRKLLFFHPLTREILTKEEKWGAALAAQFDSLIAKEHSFNFEIPNKNYLYITSKSGIISINCQTGEQKLEIPSSSWKGAQKVTLKIIDHQNNFWLTTKDKILAISPQGEMLKSYNVLPYMVEFGVVLLSEWQDQTYSINRISSAGNAQDRLYLLKTNGERQFIFEAPKEYKIHQFLDGQIWCFGQEGWAVFDLSGSLLFKLSRADYDAKLFDGVVFTDIKKDKTGKIFLPTEFGFNIIEAQKNPFRQYFSTDKEKPLPIANSARGIYAENDSVLVNFEFGGLILFQKNNPLHYDILSTSTLNPVTNRMTRYTPRSIIRDTKKHFWTGPGGYLIKWPPNLSKEEKRYVPKNDDNLNRLSWSLFEDKNNCIWSGNNNGLKRFCNNKNTSQTFTYWDSGFGFKYLDIYQIQTISTNKETDHLLWLCSNKGLFIFDTNKGKAVAHYHKNGEGDYEIPANDFLFLHIDNEENKWLGTRSGLVFWNTKTNEKRLFTRNDGLSNNVIYAALEDDFNRLWLSSDYGIMSFHKTTFEVQTYLPKHGVAQEEFNRISYFQEKDGTIYFGGLNGVTSFHPKDFVKEETNYASLVLSEFESFDGEKEELVNKLQEVTETKSITFHPNDRFFKIKFVLPTFEERSKIRYAWMIEGVHSDWIYQKDNSLQINLLPYGNHVLRIKGQNADGTWSPHELAINIKAVKPFYLQGWFLLFSFVILLLSVWRYNTYRVNKLQQDKEKLEQEIAVATNQIQEDKAFIEKQAEELKKLDKLKSRFFANISHELRTPLALMIGPVKKLIARNNHNEEDKKLLDFIQRNSLHLKNLVNEILDLSKLENNKMELKEEPINFYSFLKKHMSQFYSIGLSESKTITTTIPENEDCHILLDRNKFEKVINNFLSNAIKFTAEGGKVHLSVKEEKQYMHVIIKDNGRGIHPDDLPNIFDRFYQSKQADAATEGGTGIGLSLCLEFAQLMGGKVWAESTLGKGSTFHFQFPKKLIAANELLLVEQNGKELINNNTNTDNQFQEEIPETTTSLHKGATILIAEDNADLRAYYEIILADYQLILTEHGQAALDYLAQTAELPKLIISDLMMPVMDGMQLLERLKSSDVWRPIPVIMLTAKTNQQVKLKALRIGIDDYITKPFDDEELLVRIENLLYHAESRMAFLKEEVGSKELPTLSQEDKIWLEEFETFIQNKLDDHLLSVSWLASSFAMSESSLFRQVKRITGLSPSKYLQEFKLNQARQLLESKSLNSVAQIAYKVGFKDAKHFARNFKNRYGKAPSEYLN